MSLWGGLMPSGSQDDKQEFLQLAFAGMDILEALKNLDPTSDALRRSCRFCGAYLLTDTLEHHTPACVWRRAKLWSEQIGGLQRNQSVPEVFTR